MQIPYNQVHANGDILFAAQSGRIYTYTIGREEFVASWQHPDVEKVANAIESNKIPDEQTLIIEASTEANTPQDQDDTDGPPAKRQKVAAEDDVSNSKPEEPPQEEGVKRGKKGKFRNNKDRVVSRVPDRPIVTHLKTSADGKYLLAVTGHDKTIWTFEHDGKGHLTLISQRAMPKRPSAIDISSDGKIICGDKFGDVYALPLVQDASWVAQKPTAKARTKPAANNLTVHSKRNLEALRDQQKQIEKDLQAKEEDKDDGVDFDLQLLLGHVSMLTALTLGEQGGSKFIITGDRDEHIRVSRYMPHAHIIEEYCHGHDNFVGALLTPPSRPEVLISGGGDNELFVWNWLSGERMSTTSVLNLAQQVNPDLTKLAVTNLYSLEFRTDVSDPSTRLTFVLAICEKIKAIFSWQLTEDNTLVHPSVIQLPGNPLSLAVAPRQNDNPKIIAAYDSESQGGTASLFSFSLNLDDNRLVTGVFGGMGQDNDSAADLEMEQKDIHNLLYNIEHLRKQKVFGEEAEEELEEELVVPPEVDEQ